MAQTAAQAVFTSYAKLNAQDRKDFHNMQFAWDLKAEAQTNAGKKAAATKKDGKAKPAAGGSEA